MVVYDTLKQKLDDALAFVEANPEEWEQRSWLCGTTACFGGWLALRNGWTAVPSTFAQFDSAVAKHWGGEQYTAENAADEIVSDGVEGGLGSELIYRALFSTNHDTLEKLRAAVEDFKDGIAVVDRTRDGRDYGQSTLALALYDSDELAQARVALRAGETFTTESGYTLSVADRYVPEY